MQRLLILLCSLLFAAGNAGAQSTGQDKASPFYPAPPPDTAPKTEQGAPLQGLTSPLAAGEQKVTHTAIDSEAEAQLFSSARKIVWGRYAKIKGAKSGEVSVSKQDGLWTVKGRIDSEAPGTEGDWASIDAVVERISAGHVTVRGEVAFRVAKVDNGSACKVAGSLHFRRSGKSHVWRLVEGDNPCDGTQEFFDLIYDKAPVEKRPMPAPPRKS